MDKHNIQGATPAKQARISIKAISEALTHSDIQITKTYVNTTETVNQKQEKYPLEVSKSNRVNLG